MSTPLTLDQVLAIKYISMVSLMNLKNTSANTQFVGNTTLVSKLTVNSITTIGINGISISAKNFTGATITTNNSLTGKKIYSNTYNSLNSLNSFNINIANTLSTSDIFAYNLITNISNLQINNFNNAQNIKLNNITSNNLFINANIINLGTLSSNIIFRGSVNSMIITNINVNDKILRLNYNTNTIENSTGIIIFSNINQGFIASSYDMKNYEIQAPNNLKKYMLISSTNNDINILGSSTFYNSVSSISNIYSTKGIINILNSESSLSVLNVSSFNSNLSCNNLYNSYANINNYIGNLGIINNLYQNNLGTVNNILYSKNGIVILNNMTNNNTLFVCNNTIIKSDSTFLSTLNLSNSAILQGKFSSNNLIASTITVNSDLTSVSCINSNIFLTNNINTIDGYLYISGNFICRNLSLISTISNTSLTILGNIILNNTPEYLSNIDAANANIPIGGIYRLGGLLQVRI